MSQKFDKNSVEIVGGYFFFEKEEEEERKNSEENSTKMHGNSIDPDGLKYSNKSYVYVTNVLYIDLS